MAKHRVYVRLTFCTVASLLRSTQGRVGPPLSGFRDCPEVTERVECVEEVCRLSRHFTSVRAVITELQWFLFRLQLESAMTGVVATL